MTKVKAVVRLNRANLSSNFVKVEIAVSHKTKTAYVDTGIRADVFLRSGVTWCNFRNGAFSNKENDYINKNQQLNTLLGQWCEACDHLTNTGTMSVREVADNLAQLVRQNKKVELFGELCNIYVELKNTEGKKEHAQYCKHAGGVFLEFLKGDVRLDDISVCTIMSFDAFLRGVRKADGKRKYSDATISGILARLKAILNYGQNFGFVHYAVKPFATTKIQSARVRDCSLSVEEFRRYRDADIQLETKNKARDAFLLSFYLGGANFKDIYGADLRGEEFIYIRSKTSQRVGETIRIPILPQARKIIDKYIQDDGTVDFGYKFTGYGDLLRFFARKYRMAKAEINMPSCFSYMSARKSFAQYACEVGVPDNLIDYLLGHSQNNGGVIRYYRRITPKQATAAMTRIFDYVDNPETYADFINWRAMMM